jgi:hypothetical protein
MSLHLVSVLIPTRNRVELVERSVRSLLSLSQDPTKIEIMIAYDHDDPDSKQYFSSTAWKKLIDSYGASQTACEFEPLGYGGLHTYYTGMAQQSHGQWVMIWNDDAVMLTPNWDSHVEINKDFIGMLHMATENFKRDLALFPLIPRVWLDLFGSISLHQLNDSWIQNICNEANAVLSIPVTVFHDRYDVTGNNLDETYKNRRYGKKIFNHVTMKQIRSEWAQRLIAYRQQIDACVARPDQS